MKAHAALLFWRTCRLGFGHKGVLGHTCCIHTAIHRNVNTQHVFVFLGVQFFYVVSYCLVLMSTAHSLLQASCCQSSAEVWSTISVLTSSGKYCACGLVVVQCEPAATGISL